MKEFFHFLGKYCLDEEWLRNEKKFLNTEIFTRPLTAKSSKEHRKELSTFFNNFQ